MGEGEGEWAGLSQSSAWLACMSYGFPAWNSRAAMCEAVKVKPMLQWILKDIGDARKVEHPLREAVKTK